ncbi:30S ribosomal protein S7 [Lyticum sinuosum]|uniref:30S ribosomal protein S7 n=1 Tax=Lyticum sinuosum TaxID=1332059 RepID=A0AAE4VKB7_9RICK|nr:30S ribosomal protein S7 [Lyticum sinuosum]MDZ5761105.1 30S ribosomal protein S7 [Lyticum sinuosum]
MSRKKRTRSDLLKYQQGHKKHFADHAYGDANLGKFINYVMWDGKKTIAENIVYSALEKVAEDLKSNVIDIFYDVLNRIAPVVILKSRRFSGATYQVPTSIRPERGMSLAMKWIVSFARKKSQSGKTMIEGLILEFSLAHKGDPSSGALKKAEEVKKMVEANKAYSHLSDVP